MDTSNNLNPRFLHVKKGDARSEWSFGVSVLLINQNERYKSNVSLTLNDHGDDLILSRISTLSENTWHSLSRYVQLAPNLRWLSESRIINRRISKRWYAIKCTVENDAMTPPFIRYEDVNLSKTRSRVVKDNQILHILRNNYTIKITFL